MSSSLFGATSSMTMVPSLADIPSLMGVGSFDFGCPVLGSSVANGGVGDGIPPPKRHFIAGSQSYTHVASFAVALPLGENLVLFLMLRHSWLWFVAKMW
ncbi:hypothetical protein SUGI_0851340 [Cryptomeria japonica]|nr:hypothetical protein SUGI_0851340 [Cryptomeria japonica]